jgi:branched-chain amino acid transport system permease protein
MTRRGPLLPAWAPRRAVLAAASATVALLAVVPGLGISPYVHNLLTLTFLAVSGALAWNWMGGYLGQVSFGHAAMFGLGGFVAARLVMAHVPPPLAWLAGGLAAGAFALGAHPTLRLRGPYFSIATIGMGEASRVVFTYWGRFTGGASGLSLPIDIGLKRLLYWWSLAFLALVVVASQALRRSTFGLQLLAIKSDVDAAEDVGVPSTRRQDMVFVLSGAAVGVTGGLWASYFGFIEPNDMFGFDRSISFVLTAVIGGVGTVLGPAFGAVVFVLIRQYLLGSYPQLYLGLYGALLIVIILFEPLGLSGLALRVAHRFGYRQRPDLGLDSAASAAPSSKEAGPR